MKTSYEDRLGTDSMLPLIFRMAVPAMAAQLVNLLYSIVDRIYIGHIPNVGTDALAGIGVTGSIIILVSSFAGFVSGGAAPLASISLGQGDRERAGCILGNSVSMLLFFTLLNTVIVYTCMKPVLMAVGASEATLGYAMDYLAWYMTGTIFVQLVTGLNPFINLQGRPGIAMGSVLIGAALNIALDPLFIFAFDMGVKGAALATVLSQAASCVWVMHFLLSRSASLRIEKKYMRPDRKIIGAIMGLGVSSFIMHSTESLVGFVLNGSLKIFGDVYVSALTVMQSAMQFVSIPLSGFAQGFVPVVSFNYGHCNIDRVRQGAKIAIAFMFLYNLVMNLLTIIFPGFVASIFTSDPALIATVKRVMPLFLAGMTIFGLQRACQNMFVSLGQAKVSLFIALLRKIILLIPLALILPRFMGVMGVFAAEAFSDAFAAICCTVIFFIRFPGILRRREEAMRQQ